MMKSFLNWNVRLAFGFAILTLLLIGGVSYRWMVVSDEGDHWARHTHEVISNIQDLALAMESIESATRGFVLSGKDSDLDAYQANIAKVERDQQAIRGLTVDNPVQQARFPYLEVLTAERIQRADEVIHLRRTKGFDPAMAAITSGLGEHDTDFHALIGKLLSEEVRLQALRLQKTDRYLNQAKTILVMGILLGILVAGFAFWVAVRDSKKRVAAEVAFRQSEAKYRMIVDGVHEYAILMLDPLGHVLSWNTGAERIKGYTPEEIIGKNFSCFFPPEDIERGRPQEVLRMAAAKGQYEESARRVRKDGSQFLASITITAVRNESRKLLGFSKISRDVTEHKESEAKYRGLMEAAPDAMVVVNQAGEIVLLNAQAENQFGYSRDELLGQKVTNIIPDGFADRLIADALRSVEDALDQQIGTGIELSGLRKDGTEFPIEIMLSPLESAEGILITAAVRNITTRKDAEKHLARKLEELFQSNQDLEQFAAIASHDLQEPLRMVASYTQLIARRYKGKLDSDADEFIAFAVDGAMRMQQLIQDLLAFSRVASRGAELLEISSEDALMRAIKNLGGAIQESGAVVSNDPLPRVLADESQLVQLFQNLVGNAIKYQKSGAPLVHISAVKNGNRKWIFSVKDNGLGIDPQYFERIFGMFQRLHKREEFSGTGIGLAICKKIVERHNGTISVESQPGQGSIFHFALDATEVKAQQKSGEVVCQ